jgi:single-stranded DNA-binding protein
MRNQIILIGRLAAGASVQGKEVEFYVATSRRDTESPQKNRIVVDGGLVNPCMDDLRKGASVFVEGEILARPSGGKVAPNVGYEIRATSVTAMKPIYPANLSITIPAVLKRRQP